MKKIKKEIIKNYFSYFFYILYFQPVFESSPSWSSMEDEENHNVQHNPARYFTFFIIITLNHGILNIYIVCHALTNSEQEIEPCKGFMGPSTCLGFLMIIHYYYHQIATT